MIRFHHIAWTFVLAILFGLGSASVGLAQGRTVVEDELNETDRVLEQVFEAASVEAECVRGRSLYRRARDMQGVAWADYRGNTLDGIRNALVRTRNARSLAQDALAACQVEYQAHEEVARLFESIQEMIAQTRAQLREHPDPESERLLDAGVRQLENAESSYRAKEFQQAIRKGTIANNLVERALNRSRYDAPTFDNNEVELEMAKTEDLLRSVDANALRPRVKSLYMQAQAHQDRARDSLSDGKFEKALRWTRAARVKAEEAGQALAADRPELARVEKAIDALGEMMRELGPRIREEGGPGTGALLEEAENALSQAREKLRENQVVAAARSARLAGSLFRRAAEKAGVR